MSTVDYNSDYNTGNGNIGKDNAGNRNRGKDNTGNRNRGNYNSGNYNTGNYNSGSFNNGNDNVGNHNSGSFNRGYSNTGNYNSGSFNRGFRNSGDWNTGDYNTGYFNSNTPDTVRVFNKDCSHSEWAAASKPACLYAPQPTTWVSDSNMTDEEKEANQGFQVHGGYLRVNNDMAEEWRNAIWGASEKDRQAIRDLPNFDYDIFEEITGVDLRLGEPDCIGKVVEIDGVKYKLTKV
jgi:hypothetical protein